MSKLKVAVLEDDRNLMEDLLNELKETNLVEVVAKAMDSETFMAKVGEVGVVDLLILDIELGGESRTGIDVARRLKKPVLFVSGYTGKHLLQLEDINLEHHIPVEHLTKPISASKLARILPKMAEEIRLRKKAASIKLRLGRGKSSEPVELDSIVFVRAGDIKEDPEALERDGRLKPPTLTDKSTSFNKVIFFMHRKPEMLVDQSFEDLEHAGLRKEQFITIGKSCRVNANHVISYERQKHAVIVRAMNLSGVLEEMDLQVSENYQSDARTRFR